MQSQELEAKLVHLTTRHDELKADAAAARCELEAVRVGSGACRVDRRRAGCGGARD